MKMSELIDMMKHPKKEEDASDIIARVKAKADNLRGG
jgi:hypothetical protein